jgi:DNA repair protein RecO
VSTKNVEGIVLRRWDIGESDRKIAIFSKIEGKIYAVARGARKSKLAGITEPLTSAHFEIAVGRKTSYITQAQPIVPHSRFRNDYKRILTAQSWVEILDAFIPEGEPQNNLYKLCLQTIQGIEVAQDPLAPLIWGDSCLLAMSGFGPQFSESVLSGQPLTYQEAFVSPTAGGALNATEARTFRDALRVRKEVLIALSRILDLSTPPSRVKFSQEVISALFPFLLHAAGRELPAHKALIQES